MPTWLSDPTTGFYAVVFVLVVVAVAMYLRNRTRNNALTAALAVVVFIALVLCDRLFESPREESVRKVGEISAALNERNADKFMNLVSDRFEYKTWKKADLRKAVDLAKQYNIRTAVWEFNRDRATMVANGNEIEFTFDGKAEGPGGEPLMKHFKARFIKDPDGQWRLKSFTPYNILQKENGPEETIPGLP